MNTCKYCGEEISDGVAYCDKRCKKGLGQSNIKPVPNTPQHPPNGRKLYKDEMWLRKMYQEKGLLVADIALMAGRTSSAIYYWMKRFNIPAQYTIGKNHHAYVERAKFTCEQCGEQFEKKPCEAKRISGKFCSRRCYLRSKRPILTCKVCGSQYQYSHGRSKTYCSRVCYDADRNDKVNRTCKMCGKEFITRKSQVEVGKGSLCSNQCRYNWRRKKASQKEFITCAHCGRKFEPKNYPRNGRHFCSPECLRASRLKPCERCGLPFDKPIGSSARYCPQCHKPKGRKLHKRIELTCEWCSNAFEVLPADSGKRFCSQQCTDQAIRSEAWRRECIPRNAKAIKKMAENKINGGMTDIEEICFAAFETMGLQHKKDFFFEFPLNGYNIDFFFPKYALCVEAYGGYWHGSDKAKHNDAARKASLETFGFTVLEWWEKDIKRDVMQLAETELIPIIRKAKPVKGKPFLTRDGKGIKAVLQPKLL